MRNAARAADLRGVLRSASASIITGTVLQTTPDFTIIKIREGVEAELPHFDQRRYPEERNERPQRRALPAQPARRAPSSSTCATPTVQPSPSCAASASARRSSSSRTHPDLIRRLFELEVPEVYDGVVEVKSRRARARRPLQGRRLARSTTGLDPVGACVGPKGCARAHGRLRAARRAHRRRAVERRPGPLRRQRPLAGASVTRVLIDPENQLRHGHRPRRPALARHRQGGPERPPRRAPDRAGTSTSRTSRSPPTVLRDLPRATVEEEPVDDGEAHRCEYVGPNGIQCRNMARPGSRFCGVHEQVAAAEVSSDPDSLI